MENSRSNVRIKVERAIALLLLALSLLAFVAGDYGGVSRSYTETGFKQALETYAMARGLNAVISVAQSAELSIHPAGIGASVSPGEILDPVNDLIEQFSTVMLFAVGSLGLQRLLIEISSDWALQIPLIIALLAWAVSTFIGSSPARMTCRRVALTLVLVRFAVPVAALASEGVYVGFLGPRVEAASLEIDKARAAVKLEDLERIGEGPGEDFVGPPQLESDPEKSWLAWAWAKISSIPDVPKRVGSWLDEKSRFVTHAERIDELRRFADTTVEHLATLMAVFLLQTVILPFAFLSFIWRSLFVLIPQALRLPR